MKTVVFDVQPETVASVIGQIKEKNDDSLMVLAPLAGSVSTYAPSKKGKTKGYFRIKCELWIPEDSIEGEDALTDFGAFAVLRLPKNRIKEHLK